MDAKNCTKENSNNDDVKAYCIICYERWYSDGEHRVSSLKCGHLFGKSCIERWLSSKTRQRCPQCGKPAKKKDVRVIYATTVSVLGDKEREDYVSRLNEERRMRLLAEEKEQKSQSYCNMLSASYEKLRLEFQEYKRTKFVSSARFSLLTNVSVCSEGQCRQIIYEPQNRSFLVVRNTSEGTIVKINCADTAKKETFSLHAKNIREAKLSPFCDGLIASVSADRQFRITNMYNGCKVASYLSNNSLHSVEFNKEDRNILYCGSVGCMSIFDLRQASVPLMNVKIDGSKPIHSLHNVNGKLFFSNYDNIYRWCDKNMRLETIVTSSFSSAHCVHFEVSNNRLVGTFRNVDFTKEAHIVVSELVDGEFNSFHSIKLSSCINPLSRTRVYYDRMVPVYNKTMREVDIHDLNSSTIVQSLPLQSHMIDSCIYDTQDSRFTVLSDQMLHLYKYTE